MQSRERRLKPLRLPGVMRVIVPEVERDDGERGRDGVRPRSADGRGRAWPADAEHKSRRHRKQHGGQQRYPLPIGVMPVHGTPTLSPKNVR